MAKRLLLGLHERFYHCPIGDFKNMLLRAGLSSDILPLAEEAVMSCSICRKYVRMPNRPQVKIGSHAGTFNQRVQLDLFQYQEVWILLLVDEATRFKVATDVESREHGHLLPKMLDVWFVVLGPPHQLVLDQESSLMLGRQATYRNGLVERHIGLVEITMLKLAAELDRQGLRLTPGELAKEAAVSHNQSLNYNGATPSMAVFGILPRPFYQDDYNNITAVAGALQTDITPFEKALRIRQLSLSMVQRAVAEDRIARAGRTRPHKLDTNIPVPGTTTIDFYREIQGDVGWRGPATLLRLDKDEGTAILTYQGRPYL
ncbi:CPK34, partial [Symbiodinium pilosum]